MLEPFHNVVHEVREIWVCQLCPTFHLFSGPLHHYLTWWVQQGAQVAQLPMWQSPRGGKTNILNEKIFLPSRNWNCWTKEKGNSINSCHFLKVGDLYKGWSLWLLAPSIKEPGHATVCYCTNLSHLVCLSFPIICHGAAVPIFVLAFIVWLFLDFRILQDEGTIFLWSVGIC